MSDLNQSPGAFHGIAESGVGLGEAERLRVALKACDLYLERMGRIEAALEACYPAAERAAAAYAELGKAVNALADAVYGKGTDGQE